MTGAGLPAAPICRNNPWLGTPRLRLATCSSSTRQQWSFESRSFANPVGYGHDDFIGSRVY